MTETNVPWEGWDAARVRRGTHPTLFQPGSLTMPSHRRPPSINVPPPEGSLMSRWAAPVNIAFTP
jgi:hypothetical protein